MNPKLSEKIWWGYLPEDLQELLTAAIVLTQRADKWGIDFNDYSFVVFPASKAYEGFLKKLFLDLGFIDEKDYYGKRFRVGKALNPTLPPKYRNDSWVYGKLVDFCNDEGLARFLWDTWRNCRNLVFHWFPDEKRVISLPEAKRRIQRIIDSIDKAYTTCKIK